MILDVVITPEAVKEPTAFLDDKKKILTALMEFACTHGTLRFATRGEASEFMAAVKRAEVQQKQWKERILRTVPRPQGGLPPVAPDGGRSVEAWASAAQVVIVPPDAATEYGMPPATRSWRMSPTGPYVVHSDGLHWCDAITKVRRTAVQINHRPADQDAPTTRAQAWTEWLSPLAEAHRFVTLVDKYVGQATVSAAHFDGFGDESPKELPWLLAKLASTAAEVKTFTLVTGVDNGNGRFTARAPAVPKSTRKARDQIVTPEAVQAAIEEAWTQAKVNADRWGLGHLRPLAVELQTFPVDARRHSRHLRFSSNALSHYVVMDAGFDRFREERFSDAFDGDDWRMSYFVAPREPSPAGHGAPSDETALRRQTVTSTFRLD